MGHNKIAVVTGASQGIGRAVSTGLLRAGWDTVLVSRNAARLQQVIEQVGPVQAQALAWQCDISVAGEVDALFAAVKARFGRIDLLFNNAGISGPAGTIDEIPVAGWEQTLAVNLNGAFLCARAA